LKGTTVKTLGTLAFATLLGIPLAAWKAYVAIILWGWFVQPITGWAAPGLWTAAGIFAMLGLASNWAVKTKADDYGDDTVSLFAYGIVIGLMMPAMALLSGFVFKTLGG
jgi:hypothetical protein